MALLTSYPILTLTHALGHDASNNVGRVVLSGLGGGGSPGGSATELQYRGGASTFSAVTGSTVAAGGKLTLGGTDTGKLVLTGSAVASSGLGTGFAQILGCNDTDNKQFFLGDTDYAGVAASTFIRVHVGSGYSGLDCVNGNNTVSYALGLPGGFHFGNNPAFSAIMRAQGGGEFSIINTTTPTSFQVYKTANVNQYPSTYERGVFDWTTQANTLTIGAQTAGGTLRPVNIVGSALTFNGSPISGSGGLATISDTAPAVGAAGSFWWESDTGALHISYSSAWVAVTPVPAALTKTDDTNVMLTLGGTPGTALQQPVSMTLGWAGTLAVGRGGTGHASYVVGDLLYASTITTLARLADVATGNALISGGVGVIPAWGKIENTHLATAAAFTLKANNTASAVAPADVSITGLAVKGTPTVTDFLLLSDTAAAGELKKIAWTAGGGSGSPGGSPGQLQWNSASTFGGVTGSAVSAAGALTLTNGVVTTDAPVLDLSQEWSAGGVAFSGLKFNVTNTASANGSKLLDLQVGGVTKLAYGIVQSGSQYILSLTGGFTGSDIGLRSMSGLLEVMQGNAAAYAGLQALDVWVSRDLFINSNTSRLIFGLAYDVILTRPAAAVLSITGTAAGSAGYVRLSGIAVSSLPTPSATYEGCRGTVTDATATTFFSTAVGGGSLIAPVFCTGTAWVIA